MMSQSVTKNVVYQARLHWIIFVGPCAVCMLMLWLSLSNPLFRTPALYVAWAALVWGGITCLTYICSFLMITPTQVILRTGILVRQTIDISLEKIESIDIRQSILGSLFQYGSLVITGTGGTKQYINYLDKPLTCRRYIEQALHHPL